MSSLFRTLLALLAVFTLSACGFSKSTHAGAKAVETFHQQFNDSKFTEIYFTTTPASKATPDLIQFITAVRHQLGTVKTTTANGWHVNTFNGVTSVVLNYKTEFEQGSGVETFTFITSGDSATLQGYNVNAQTPIINEELPHWIVPQVKLENANIQQAMHYLEEVSKQVDPRSVGIKISVLDERALNSNLPKGVTVTLPKIPFKEALIYIISRFSAKAKIQADGSIRIVPVAYQDPPSERDTAKEMDGNNEVLK